MTKKPRTFALRYVPCDCQAREGCDRCNHTGYRTEHVPLADAILEVEEENARLYLESVKQDASPTVGKEQGYIILRCDICNWPHWRKTERTWVSGSYDLCTGPCNRYAPHSVIPSGAPALLPPHSARQSGTQVGDQPYSDAEKGTEWGAGPEKETPDCPHCGWPSRNMAIVERIPPCPECAADIFYTVRSMHSGTTIDADGTIRVPALYGGFKCAQCGTKIP